MRRVKQAGVLGVWVIGVALGWSQQPAESSSEIIDRFFAEEGELSPGPTADSSRAEGKQEPSAVPWTVLDEPELSGVLTASRSPYLLSRSALIPVGQVLRIEPGVEVMISGEGTRLEVKGILRIDGHREGEVVFRSLAERPIPGAWEGIAFRPGSRGDLSGLRISHARNGIAVTDARVQITESVVDQVTGAAVTAIRSTVQIERSTLGQESPHGLGLYADLGSRVEVVRGKIAGASIGIAATGYASILLYDAVVEENHTGMLLVDSVAVELSGTSIRENSVGVVSSFDPGIKLRGWAASLGLFGSQESLGLPPEVKGNSLNWTRMPAVNAYTQIAGYDLPPEALAGQLKIRPREYRGGLRSDAVEVPEVQTFGSVALGLEYHNVETPTHDGIRPAVVGRDTVMPGERFPNRFQVERYRPYVSVYSQTRFGADRLLEVQGDVAHDDWEGWSARPVSLQWESPRSVLKLGHFVETGADLVIDGVSLLGGGYGYRSPLSVKRTTPFFQFDVVAGEVRQPLSEGERNPEIFAEVIGPGEAHAQELFAMARASISPWNRTEFALGFERNWDRREDPWIRDQISVKSELDKSMVDARAIFAEWNGKTAGGGFEWRAAAIHGTPDSTQFAWNAAVDRWIDENNILLEADTLRTLLKKSTPPLAAIQEQLPALLGKTAPEAVQEIRKLRSEIRDSLSTDRIAGIDPAVDHLGGSLGLDWRSDRTMVSLQLRYLGREFFSPGSPDLQPNAREYSFRWSQGVKPWWDFGFSGLLRVEEASSDPDKFNLFGFDETTKAKTSIAVDLDNRWKLSDGWELNLAYGYQYKFRRSDRWLLKDTTSAVGVFADPWFSGTDDTLRYLTGEIGIDTARWGRYTSSSDTLASRFKQELLTHTISGDLTRRFDRSNISFGAQLRWDRDLSGFRSFPSEKSWALADTTWGKMGYRFGQYDGFVGTFPLRLNWRGERLSDRLVLQGRYRSGEASNYREKEIAISDAVEWRAIPARWTLTAEAGAKYRTLGYEADDFFLKSKTTDEICRYLAADSSGVLRPQKHESADAIDVSEQTELPGYELGNNRKYRDYREEEYDFYVSLLSRYAVTSQLQLELETRWDDFRRPDFPEEGWNDFSSHLRLIWEF